MVKGIQLLDPMDIVNISRTCHRLKAISHMVLSVKYKQTRVTTQICGQNAKLALKELELQECLQVIGKHVIEIKLFTANQKIVDLVKWWCPNLRHLILRESNFKIFQLNGFNELEVFETDSRMSEDDWRVIVYNNKNIQRIDHYSNYDEIGFFESIIHLQSLKSLKLPWLPENFHTSLSLNYLLKMKSLTNLAIRSEFCCNDILKAIIQLTAKLLDSQRL